MKSSDTLIAQLLSGDMHGWQPQTSTLTIAVGLRPNHVLPSLIMFDMAPAAEYRNVPVIATFRSVEAAAAFAEFMNSLLDDIGLAVRFRQIQPPQPPRPQPPEATP